MARPPKRIAPCPIASAAAEIRFSSDTPEDAFFGLLYPTFKKDYPGNARLPILDLPPVVRNTPDFIFSGHHQLSGNEGYVINIGPRSFAVISNPPYQGWPKFREVILDAFQKFFEKMTLSDIHRVSLRYVSFFPGDILPTKTNLALRLNEESLLGPETQLRTLINRDDFRHILNITNMGVRKRHEGNKVDSETGTLIDVDSLAEKVPKNFNSERQARLNLLDQLHLSGKRLFFDNLTEDFVKTLRPEY